MNSVFLYSGRAGGNSGLDEKWQIITDKSGRVTAVCEYGESSDSEGGMFKLSIYDENGEQTHTVAKSSVTYGTYHIGDNVTVIYYRH